MITVYSTPNCVQCMMTKKYLDKLRVEYKAVDLSQDEASYDMVKSLGYSAAPVVIVDDLHWSGFRPELLAMAVKKVENIE